MPAPSRPAGSSALVALAICIALSPPRLASAAPPDAAPATPVSAAARAEAERRFERGVQFFEEASYPAALGEFRKAYELSPNFNLLYNIGQVCYQLQDYACALQSLQEFLRQGGAGVDAERRVAVEADLVSLSSRVARLGVVTDVPGAELSIDDVPVGRTPLAAPLIVGAGRRKVTAVRPGGAPVSRVVDVAGGDALEVKITLGAPPAPAPAAPAPAPAAPPRFTALSWAGFGAGGALAAGALATGLLARGASHEMAETRFAGPEPSDEARSKGSEARALALASDVLSVAAVGTLATTLVLTFVRGPARPAPVSVGLSPAGAAITGRF